MTILLILSLLLLAIILWKLHLWNWLLPSADCQCMPNPLHLLSFTKACAILHPDNILSLAALQLHLWLLHMGRCMHTPLLGSVHLLLQVYSHFCLVFPWWNNYLPFSQFTSRWANSVTGALLPCDTIPSRSLIFQYLHLAFFITLFEAGL